MGGCNELYVTVVYLFLVLFFFFSEKGKRVFIAFGLRFRFLEVACQLLVDMIVLVRNRFISGGNIF